MPAGHPTHFKPEYVEQVRKLAALGATDKELADFFNISEATLNNWKIAHPEFLESMRGGKDDFDSGRIKEALCKRALGFMRKVERVSKDGIVMCLEEVPPDTASIKFWLTNRQRHLWAERQEVEQVGVSTVEVNVISKPKP